MLELASVGVGVNYDSAPTQVSKKIGKKFWERVICFECGFEWEKRTDTLKNWSGKCRSCVQKEIHGSDEYRKKQSILSRNQVLRQGGIPNAKPFTTYGSRGVKGSLNCKWKGGKCDTHTGLEYVEWRKRVYVRDGFTCQVCGQVGGKIHAHHIKSFSEFPDSRYLDGNGVTLCVPCHKEIHKTLRLMKNV